jgi:hypothetical protein
MPRSVDTRPLVEPFDVPDARELVWIDRVLLEKLTDAVKRERLARQSNQSTLALVLEAQIASLRDIRSRVHHRYWSLRVGVAPTR